MNQIMVNAVEFESLLKEVEYLKHENQKLEEQLKDAQGRIRVLKEERAAGLRPTAIGTTRRCTAWQT
jgi:predicted  nucleic acid-binding Zn-ribbon protein